ncbi:MAG TPA: hypothetical protein VM618_00975 [Acidimicrobiia bacterium]|nr:hypothetical protein [Acidimicrobiia bacterium]
MRQRRWMLLTVVSAVVWGLFPDAGPATADDLPSEGPLRLNDSQLVEVVTVDAADPSGSDTVVPLAAGRAYVFEVSGEYSWGLGDADAECATFDTDTSWTASRFATIHPHMLDLVVSGGGVEWEATQPDPAGCNTTDHTYRLWYQADVNGPVNFRIEETNGWYPDNTGTLTVRVHEASGVPPDGTEIDRFTVASNVVAGATSSASLSTSTRYRIVATGSYRLQTGPEIVSDAECISVGGAPFTRQDELDGTGETKDLYLNGADVDWVSTTGVTGCNESSHTYVYEFVPQAPGPVNLAVRDVYYPDNVGTVEVVIQEIGPPPPPSPTRSLMNSVTSPSLSDVKLVEEVRVDSSRPEGASTLQSLFEGQSYIFEAVGTYSWGLGRADAECATFDVDQTWQPSRFAAIDPHMLDVQVNGNGVAWRPTNPDPAGCNTSDHTYRYWFTANETGPATFRVNEAGGYYPDNRGIVTVRVFEGEGVPPDGVKVDEFLVPANSPAGAASSVSLSPIKRYRIAATGTFKVQSGPDMFHDAECLQVAAGPFTRQDQLDDAGEMKDLYVEGREVDWVPSSGRSGCDERFHAYLYEFVPPTAGPLDVAIRDVYYPDNQGALTVEVFEIGPPPPAPAAGALEDLLSDPPSPGELSLVEEVRVNPASQEGATSAQTLLPGETYIFEALGTYAWGVGDADVECATYSPDATWLRDRFSALDPHMLDLLVQGRGVDWMPTNDSGGGCNTTNHTYRVWYRPTMPERVNFRVNEAGGWYPDNRGLLTVRILFAEGVPPEGTLVDEFALASSNPAGASSSVTLQPGRRYRLAVTGTFTTPDVTHDAECISVGALPFTRQDQLDATGETKDVWVNGEEVDWVASSGRTGCDEKLHTYLLLLEPATAGPVHLAVRDQYYPDNQGVLDVEIWELPR